MKVISKSTKGINCKELKKEVEIMEKLIHPNIVCYFDSYENENNFSIIVECMDGGDLRRLLDRERLDEQTIYKMLE